MKPPRTRLVGAAALAAACAAGGAGAALAAQAMPLIAQRSHVQCPVGGRQAAAWLIDDPSRWRAAVSASEALGREVRWGEELLLVVALAQQPTLGIGVSLDGEARRRAGSRLELQARVQRPAPGELAATAISRPCVIAALPKDWRRRRITVWLEGRRLEAERTLPPPPQEGSKPRLISDHGLR